MMNYNFIIVQQSVDFQRDMDEGRRLCELYHTHTQLPNDLYELPFFAIINPLTGGIIKKLERRDYLNKDNFHEFITGVICENNPFDKEQKNKLPNLLPFDIEKMTSNCSLTPSVIKPLKKLEDLKPKTTPKPAVNRTRNILAKGI